MCDRYTLIKVDYFIELLVNISSTQLNSVAALTLVGLLINDKMNT